MKFNKKVGHNYGHEHDHENEHNNQNKHNKDVNPVTGNHTAHEHTSPIYRQGTITNQGHGLPGHNNNKRDKNNPGGRTRGKGNGNKNG